MSLLRTVFLASINKNIMKILLINSQLILNNAYSFRQWVICYICTIYFSCWSFKFSSSFLALLCLISLLPLFSLSFFYPSICLKVSANPKSSVLRCWDNKQGGRNFLMGTFFYNQDTSPTAVTLQGISEQSTVENYRSRWRFLTQ